MVEAPLQIVEDFLKMLGFMLMYTHTRNGVPASITKRCAPLPPRHHRHPDDHQGDANELGDTQRLIEQEPP